MAACDLGRDYEHCLELQKKVNDVEAVRKLYAEHYFLIMYLFGFGAILICLSV